MSHYRVGNVKDWGPSMETKQGPINVYVNLLRDVFELNVSWSPNSNKVAITGPSGSGKSSLLRVLAGLEPAAQGIVQIHGETWLDTEAGVFVPTWERQIGWVPQDSLLFPHLSIQENLAYAGAGPLEITRVSEMLYFSGLLERRPRFLSGGERQRVALGRALLSRPKLLLLDEPFSALDRALRLEIANVVRDYAQEHQTPMVVVSHDESDARLLADQSWVLVAGRMTEKSGQQGPP